ncbi:hypothetical protein [Sphingomonas sp. SUN039]|uniref:hypothetical protein n=1 Tax=Sphingomonas sp. SUN039 TaxID=2937787 RepID=UPI002164D4E1|nr:hypothetical protein [Sphingomonas sp. SUN039]UVO54228.1 hypothetical protein M0209_08905 [Sphingomonas sp. SUN039]
MRKTALLILATAFALAACNRGPEQQPLEDNVVDAVNATENANVAVAPPPVNAANATNATTAKAAPAPGFTDDQQMHDDADATGMTARLPDDAAPSGNETAPVK